MATRGKTTLQKRQKEMARKDKRQRKEERRAQRKLGQPDAGTDETLEVLSAPEIEPQDVSEEISLESSAGKF